jgi:hypothetical protein
MRILHSIRLSLRSLSAAAIVGETIPLEVLRAAQLAEETP